MDQNQALNNLSDRKLGHPAIRNPRVAALSIGQLEKISVMGNQDAAPTLCEPDLSLIVRAS